MRRYSQIRTPDYEFSFNQNGEITTIRGLHTKWPHPSEHLKRTAGNDWIYYTVGDKSGDDGIISWMGEYCLPCLPYPSNPVWEIEYVNDPVIMNALASWYQLHGDLYMARSKWIPPYAKNLVDRILANDERTLHERSQRLQRIIGGRFSVLPPDIRHVDYQVIPLTIADGCLYQCKFCCVKSKQAFGKRSQANIEDQITALNGYFGRDLENYRALFLGNHDALAAGVETICFTARAAHLALGFQERLDQGSLLYLFGSVGSLLAAPDVMFETLDQLPFYTHINIGFESVDPSTLKKIGKPTTAQEVREAFSKMLAINAAFDHLEITGNFVAGEDLPSGHEDSLSDLLKQAIGKEAFKGGIYLSPLQNSPKKRELLPRFYTIKSQSRLPVWVYLIQRL